MIAGTLELQMSANIARLADDMGKAKTMVGSSMKSIEGAVASAKSALGALGIGLGVGYFVSLIKGAIDAADHLEQLTKATRLTVPELAGLKLLAAETGTDLDGLAKGIDKMSVAIGKDPEKFRALGITAKDNKEAFKQFADIFNLLPDVHQRNALAQAVFNKSWAEMAPALSLGGKEIGEVMEKGARLSGVTEDMTKRAHELKVQMAELETALGATRTKLVGDMLPGMNEIAAAMREAAKEGGLWLTVLVGIGGAIDKLLGFNEMEKAVNKVSDLRMKMAWLEEKTKSGAVMRWLYGRDFETELAKAKIDLDKAMEALRVLRNPAPAAPGVKPGIDSTAAAEAAARTAAFLKDQDLYAARVAAIKGFAATYSAAIKTQSTLADLAFKEGGINNQRTQEELILQQSALEDKKLRSQLESFQKLKALADKRGPAGGKDAAANAELIVQTNAAIVANEVITQAQIRAARTVTAQQRAAEYNAWADGLAAQGEALAVSLGTQAEIENKAYADRLSALEVYLAANREQITNDKALREALEIQHQQNLLAIERQKNEAQRSMEIATWQAGADLLQQFAGKSKVAAIAAIAIQKALAIAQVIMNTQVAVMRGYAELGPIGGTAHAVRMEILGAIQIGLITATGLVQAANVGGGGASVGSPANPVNTTSSPVGAGGASQQQARGPDTFVTIPIREDGVYSGRALAVLVKQLNEFTRDGGRVVVSTS